MSDPFGIASGGSLLPSPPSWPADEGVVKSPTALIVALIAELAITALCFVPSTPAFFLLGYVIGALAVAATAVAFRCIDRVRRRSPRFVSTPGLSQIVVAGLVVGLAMAAVHAFYLAQNRSLL